MERVLAFGYCSPSIRNSLQRMLSKVPICLSMRPQLTFNLPDPTAILVLQRTRSPIPQRRLDSGKCDGFFQENQRRARRRRLTHQPIFTRAPNYSSKSSSGFQTAQTCVAWQGEYNIHTPLSASNSDRFRWARQQRTSHGHRRRE